MQATNAPAYLSSSSEIKNLYNINIRDRIHYTSFSLKLMNGHNTFECYIILGWKSLPGINNLAYLAFSKLRIK